LVDTIKIGLIGAGAHANAVHYPSLARIREAEIVAICDIDEKRLNNTADKYGIELRFKDYKEMLEKVRLDAVYIIMAPVPIYNVKESLVDIAINCLKRGLHVFIEKPPGITSKETRKMAEVAERYGCKTMVGFNRRFIPVFRKAKQIVEERGRITHCLAAFHKDMIGKPQPWGKVSYLVADVIHAVDALRFMAGDEADKVSSIIMSFYANYPNSFNALIKFKNGCIGHLCANYSSGGRVHYFEMHSKGIYAFVNLPFETEMQEARILKDGKPYAEIEIIKNVNLVGGNKEFYMVYGFYQENKHFIDCIIKDEEPETNFKDAIKTMELVERIGMSK